jgi:predicted MFS family arabinose efflux permease
MATTSKKLTAWAARPGRLVVALLFFAPLLAALQPLAVIPFLPSIAGDLGTTTSVIGQVPALTAILASVVGLFAGPLADRFGYRQALLVAMLALAAGSLCTALAPTVAVLLGLTVFGVVSRAITAPVSQVIAGASFADEEARRRAVSLVTAGASASLIVGMPTLTAVASFSGWRGAFVALTLLAITATLAVRALPRDEPSAAESVRARSTVAAYAPLLRHRPSLGIVGASLLAMAGTWAFYTYLGALLRERFGLGELEAGGVLMVAGAAMLLGGSATGGRLGRQPLHPLLIGVTALSPLPLFGALLLPVSAPATVALVALNSFAVGIICVASATLLLNESPGGRATTMTLNQSAVNLGSGVGSALGGIAVASIGYSALGLILPFFGVAAALVLWRSRPAGTMALATPRLERFADERTAELGAGLARLGIRRRQW